MIVPVLKRIPISPRADREISMKAHELSEQLKQIVKGEVMDDAFTKQQYNHDASLFQMTPSVVVFPRDPHDLKELVHFVDEQKKENPELSLTMRSAGTDMTGGPLTDSISVVMKHFNRIIEIKDMHTTVEPGVYYRDLEKQLNKHHLLYPSYPASKNLCTVGGIANNNSGGERSLEYGKTEKYVEKLKVILRDGNEYIFNKISKEELTKKMKEKDFEGELYRKVYQLVEKNYDLIQKARPTVSKNSTGYNIWNIWDRKTFDMTQSFIGAQGTLGIVTEIKFKLVPKKTHRGMLIIFMKDLENLPAIVNAVLKYKPVSFESFDDHTLRLALRYFFAFAKLLGGNIFKMIIEFLPEFMMVLKKGMPKLVLLVEFEGDELSVIHENVNKLNEELQPFTNITTEIAKHKKDIEKYFAIRRESFNLLRQRIHNKHTAPFIDDLCVKPEVLPEFLPQLYKILDDAKLLYTIAGHVGDGNFHIIPLMNLSSKEERDKIFVVMDQVFPLVLKYGGSLSGEHNDGLIRSPYLTMQYGNKMYDVFKELKEIFDPDNIFNPHKKIGATREFAASHMIKN